MPWNAETAQTAVTAHPPILTALTRGALGRCPACGQGRLFNGFLRTADECTHCHTPLGRIRADDAPPYFTILVVGQDLLPRKAEVIGGSVWMIAGWLVFAIWVLTVPAAARRSSS